MVCVLLAVWSQEAARAAFRLVSSCWKGGLDPSVSQSPWSLVSCDSHLAGVASPPGPAQTRARQFLMVPRSLADRRSECGLDVAAGQEMLLKTQIRITLESQCQPRTVPRWPGLLRIGGTTPTVPWICGSSGRGTALTAIPSPGRPLAVRPGCLGAWSKKCQKVPYSQALPLTAQAGAGGGGFCLIV